MVLHHLKVNVPILNLIGRIWMDNVACGPGDEVLDDCDFNGWGIHNCRHSDDVGVICRPSKQLQHKH
jgi:hypothetical protein